jgi:hypothetical protein
MNDNNNDWIGKKLTEKDNPRVQRTVVGQKDSTLLLDNNGRIDESIVSHVFNEQSISDNIDPDSFFNSGFSTLGGLISDFGNSPQNTKTIGIQDNSNSVVEFKVGNSDAIAAHETGNYAQHQPKSQTQPPLNNYGLEPEDAPKVKKYYGKSMVEEQLVDEEEFDRVNNHTIPNHYPRTTKKKSMFDSMTLKKSTPIKIKVVIEEKIPKIEAIRNLNDLFDESIIEHLAAEITDKFLKDPKLLQQLIIDTLDGIVYPNKKKKTVAKKTTAKSKPVVRKNSQAAKAKTNTKKVSND